MIQRPRPSPFVHRCALALAVAAGLPLAAQAPANAARAAAVEPGEPPRRIVLLAGDDDDHLAGTHEYAAAALRLAQWLEDGAGRWPDGTPRAIAEVHLGGWPADELALNRADAIVFVTAGADQRADMHPLLRPGHVASIRRQAERGCGLALIHRSTFVPRGEVGDAVLDWVGGHFDYESGPAPKHWASGIEEFSARCEPVLPEDGTPRHPILNGIVSFELRDEWCHHLRFAPDGVGRKPGILPLLTVTPPGSKDADGKAATQVVAWARERADGGRGFGFTGGHYLENWSRTMVRRLLVQGCLWIARCELPDAGADLSTPAQRPVLLVTGHDHPAHDWRQVSQAYADVLGNDPRLAVERTEDPEALARPDLARFAAVLLVYNHWDRAAPSAAARGNLLRYVQQGGGLVLPHLAGTNFMPDLPIGPAADWPEFRQQLAARYWRHTQPVSGHDAYGPLRVEISNERHPITWGAGQLGALGAPRGASRTDLGMRAFDSVDELYYAQGGDLPIEPLLVARSKDTGRYQPLAWARTVGKGRVFQTLLGHAADSVRAPGNARLIARAVAWTAGIPVVELPGLPLTPAPTEGAVLVEGRSGRGLDVRRGGRSLPATAAMTKLPLSVQCAVRLGSKQGNNVLLACEPKASATHWELEAQAVTGFFQAYLPGFEPAELVSKTDIADGAWHRVAMECDGKNVRLLVDGVEVVRQAVRSRGRTDRVPGTLDLGFTQDGAGRIGCDGVLDDIELRLADGAVTRIDFDSSATGGADELPANATAAATAVPERDRPWTPPPLEGADAPPWQKETDADWNDDRFARMDTGTFLCASVLVPELGDAAMTPKAIAVQLRPRTLTGDRRPPADDPGYGFLYDTELLRAAACWRGPFLEHAPARFGLLEPPKLGAPALLTLARFAGWAQEGEFRDPRQRPVGPLAAAHETDERRFVALHRAGDDVVFETSIGGVAVLERPGVLEIDGAPVFLRDFVVGATTDPWQILIADAADGTVPEAMPEGVLQFDRGGQRTSAALIDPATAGSRAAPKLVLAGGGTQARLVVQVPPGKAARRFRVFVHGGRPDAANLLVVQKLAALAKTPGDDVIARLREELDLAGACRHTPSRWGPPLATRGLLAPAEDEARRAYVVDSLEMPRQNPWSALCYASGLDFLRDGRMAVCTAHGDVWLVDGIDATLEHVTWKRFATGLHQPLGLLVVDGVIHVTGRDGITQLIDRDGDGEADTYRAFNRDVEETGAAHLFAMGLERDAEGRLLFVKSGDRGTKHGGALCAVSRDGKQLELLATGYRHGNGLGAGGDGWITTADNEGNWVPATRLDVIQPGAFTGYVPGFRGVGTPSTFAPPLCWIPHEVDNSAGGQVFVDRTDFGPLSRQLLHLSFGKAQAMLVLHETVDTPNGPVLQGGVVPLPLEFSSGAMRGRFRPQDGQLYVCGLDGWQTAAVRDGCVARVRWTKQPFRLPVALHVHQTGLRLKFPEPLDRSVATDVKRYTLARWNYRWSQEYGSPKLSFADARRLGEDPVAIESAELSINGRELLLRTAPLAPVMQMRLSFDIRGADGARVVGAVYPSVRALGPALPITPAATPPGNR